MLERRHDGVLELQVRPAPLLMTSLFSSPSPFGAPFGSGLGKLEHLLLAHTHALESSLLACMQWRMQDERQGGAETIEMLICVKI